MGLKQNTWKLNQWYDQDVAGNVSYSAPVNLWGAGKNSSGALGLNYSAPGAVSNISSPVQIPGTNWKIGSNIDPSMSGNDGWMGLKTDGTLWGWGLNDFGQLGNNPGYSPQPSGKWSSPVQVPGTDWKSVNYHYKGNGGIKTDGTLWMWGNNEWGILGQNQHDVHRSSPTQVPGTTWDTCGNNMASQSIARKTDGTLWVWGSNSYGSLGQNSTVAYSSPVQIPGTTWGRSISNNSANVAAIKTDGTLWAWGKGVRGANGQNNQIQYSSPVQVGSDTTWEKVVVGLKGWLAIKTDGTLWGIGSDYYGELGQNTSGTYISSPIQIPGTNWSSTHMDAYSGVATKTDGTAWGWGENSYVGSLGLGDAVDRSSPSQIPGTSWNMAYTNGTTSLYLTQQ